MPSIHPFVVRFRLPADVDEVGSVSQVKNWGDRGPVGDASGDWHTLRDALRYPDLGALV